MTEKQLSRILKIIDYDLWKETFLILELGSSEEEYWEVKEIIENWLEEING